jgi:multidrug resistance efflux pump
LHFVPSNACLDTYQPDRSPAWNDAEDRMAEIRIERKRRGLGWLWLLLALLIVAGLAWYFLYPGRAAPTTTGAPTTGASQRAVPPTPGFVGALAVS